MSATSPHGAADTSFAEELLTGRQRRASVAPSSAHGSGLGEAEPDEAEVMTKTQFEEVQRQKYDLARGFVIEFLSYIAFLIVFMVVTYSFRSSWEFYNGEAVRQALLTPAADSGFGPSLDALRSVDGFWHYFGDAFLPRLYPEVYEGSGLNLSDYDGRFAMQYNYRVGAMRWRQIRVKQKQECAVDPAFSGFVRACYPAMDEAEEDTAPFGPNHTFRWRTEQELCGVQKDRTFCSGRTNGVRSDCSYPGSGYAFDFAPNSTALDQLQFLQLSGFVGAWTRAMIIDFTLYNSNTYLLLACRILVEFYPIGQILSSSSVKPVPLMTFERTEQVLELAGEILLGVFIVFYITRETQEFLEHKRIKFQHCSICVKRQRPSASAPQKEIECYICGRHFDPFEHTYCPLCQREIEEVHICWKGYFLDPWNVIDIVNLILFIVVLSLRFHLHAVLYGYNYDVGDGFLQFYPLANQYYLCNWLNSFNALLCYLKFFKYLARIKQLKTLIQALALAGEELFYFVIIFFVVFIGFSMSFYMAFCGDVPAFSHWFTSCYSLFSLILGDVDYDSLRDSNRILAPLLFFAYLSLVWFVLVNVFVAIISGAYASAIDNQQTASDDFLASSLKLFFREWKTKLLGCLLERNDKLQKVQRLLTAIEQLSSISEEQKDEVRALQREIMHDPGSAGLMSKLLKEFPNKPFPVPCNAKDFGQLRRTVIEHKRLLRLERYKKSTFDVDEYDTLELMLNPGSHMSEAEAARMKERLIGPDGNPLSAIDLVREVQRQQQLLEHKFDDLMAVLEQDAAPELPRQRRLSISARDGGNMRSFRRRSVHRGSVALESDHRGSLPGRPRRSSPAAPF
eukprot:GGOE01001345.1.p1 GENE.GGOE01001345.1~~GGOE01001345.1.p1  ORF type:complete len:861 (-),score=284.46 GGOE01001345.1:30-2579(-)